MSGGNGNDTFFVENAGDTVTESSSLGGNDSVISSVSFTLGTFVENLTLSGFSSLSGTGNTLANEIIGNAAGNTLSGLDGDDTLEGRGGNDTVRGGAGNDTYVFTGASLGNDTFIDSGGADTIVIDSLSDVISTNRVGNDLWVILDSGSFRILNHFAGGAIESLTAGTKTVVLATGTIGGDASGIISGTSGDDTLDGRGGDDLLFGAGGKDTLIGGLGNDRIEGGNGRDIIDGGAGDDLLMGGGGRDTFVFRPASLDGGPGHDTIRNFNNSDLLDLRAFHLSFRDLDYDHHGRWQNVGNDHIDISIDHGDTVITLGQSSIRIEDFTHLSLGNLLL
jgi:Ca2+-binding RTX toxin-like protein